MLELDGADEGGYATFAQHTRIDASTKPSIMSIFKASSTSEEKYVPQPIFADEIYLARLRALVPTKGTLESKGYTLRELASYELENKKRCKNCSKGACAALPEAYYLPIRHESPQNREIQC